VTATTDDSSSGFRLFGSTPLNQKTDIEFGFFTHSDFTVKYDFTFVPLVGTQTYSFSGLDLSAVHKPLNNGFFVKGGLHSSRYNIDTQVRSTTTGFTSSVDTSGTGIGFLAGLGYEATVSDGVKARASIVRYMNIGGESDLAMNLMTLGISKSF
jgi:opacity protein-like surface antigen